MSRRFLSPLRLTNLTSDPSGGSEGDIYFNSITKALRFHNGSGWVELADTGIANQTQKYLMEHNHGQDGLVYEVFPADTIYPETLLQQNINPTITQEPVILVFDGGSPTDFPLNPDYGQFTLIDGGGVS